MSEAARYRLARPFRRTAQLAGAALLAATVACTPDDTADGDDLTAADIGGTLIISTAADPGTLMPLYSDRSNSRIIVDQLFERLATLTTELNTVGDEGFEPALADRWSWSDDSLAIAFHLAPDARWHDGRPVVAPDVVFSIMTVKRPEVAAGAANRLAAIDSVTARDSLTAVVWFARRYPEQFFDAVEHTHILPSHILGDVAAAELRTHAFAREPVGSGPYRLLEWTPGQSVVLVADSAYHGGRAAISQLVWTIAPDPVTAATRFLAEEADVFEAVRIEHLPDIAANPDLTLALGHGFSYAFLGFNPEGAGGAPHPLFADRDVRRALSMALDRASMVRNVFDSLGVVPRGPYTRATRGADSALAQLPFDPAAARRMLDSLGWRDSDGDGTREKAGRPLAFTAIVPTSSAPRMRMAVLAQEQFKAVGAAMTVEPMEINAFLDRARSGRFDAYINAFNPDASPGGLQQTWRTGGQSNYSHYSNPTFDVAVDSMLAAGSADQRGAFLRQAYQTIVDDAAAIWLYEPVTAIGIHARVVHGPLRPDGWWRDIATWRIPADRRIRRDAMVAAQ